MNKSVKCRMSRANYRYDEKREFSINQSMIFFKCFNFLLYQVVRMLLKLLEDKNGEVQNLAVRLDPSITRLDVL